MRGGEPATAEKPIEGDTSMDEMWDEAARAFEEICGESLKRGGIRNFEDVQRRIESSGKESFKTNAAPEENWEMAKSVGLKSLKFLKLLVNTASQASSLIPIPSAAASFTGSALCFVFDVPFAIKGYNDAVHQVFEEVSSALSQFQIYRTMDHIDPLLVTQIQRVLVRFIKVCAHVVKYRQGRRRERILQQVKSIFEDDSGLGSAMEDFKRALQGQRDVQGTVTLAVALDIQQTAQDTHKDVQALKSDSDRNKDLVKIRDSLGVPSTVRLDTRTTQTCTNIADRCLPGSGSWIWTHEAYTTWTASKDEDVLVVSGPSSSGKSSATALITKRLEEQKGRTYVAHYFFPASTKKSDDDKTPVQSALKYMAFQIARVDATVCKALVKACDTGPGAFSRASSLENLETLWGELKIGAAGSGASYYLVFDGLENLRDKHADMLLRFLFGLRREGESAKRVRFLVSGADEQFARQPGAESALRIHMEQNNGPDMRILIGEALAKQELLQNVKNGSEQQKARDKIFAKLPQNVNGSYSRLQFGLDSVIRLLSTRTAVQELDKFLDQSISSHEAAIKDLQRSLTADEIAELNELLRWVIFANFNLSLAQLESAMGLYSGIASLTSLEYIIRNKYSAVLKLDDGCVLPQDGVLEYMQKKRDLPSRSSHSKDRPTISMTIAVNNVDQELCGHFLWDLADMAIRDKFKFDFSGDVFSSGGQNTIAVDEFEANHTIVTRAFEFLRGEPREETREIGEYLVTWLPYHLGKIRQLEDDDREAVLTPRDQLEIGQNLYELFRDDAVVKRHKDVFSKGHWIESEIEELQKWLNDSAVVRRVDRAWKAKVQRATSPTKGFLNPLVKTIVEGFLRGREWGVQIAFFWIVEFMAADEKKPQVDHPRHDENEVTQSESAAAYLYKCVNYDEVSKWCQDVLGLSDSDLDSLWWERLAEGSVSRPFEGESPTVSLYQRAIELKDPSWRCHQGLSAQYRTQDRLDDAIKELELALTEAEKETASPKPEPKDICELHILLGDYLCDKDDTTAAARHYLFACNSEDPVQAERGRLGHFKTVLNAAGPDETRQFFKKSLMEEDGKQKFVSVLKMVARDWDHKNIILSLLTTAKQDPELLKSIFHAMHAAAVKMEPQPNGNETVGEIERFAEDEARGVMLFELGVASYRFKLSSDGTDPILEAMRVWTESRDVLAPIGGSNASVARENATSALANHYFLGCLDGGRPDYLEALKNLCKEDTDSLSNNDAVGFLGGLHSLHGEKEQARTVLARYVKQALQILSDEMPENDLIGYSILHETLGNYLDFKNESVAAALLGQPDLVREAGQFELQDLTDVAEDETQAVLDAMDKLGNETFQRTNAEEPDTTKQIERLQVAKVHVDSLVSAAETDAKTTEGDEGHDTETPRPSNPTSVALRLLQTRLDQLVTTHNPELNFDAFSWGWSCDGRTADGKPCKKRGDFETAFYHCMYCTNKDLCWECLGRLRDPTSDVIPVCSPKHRWLRVPPYGSRENVGSKSKTVLVPSSVEPVDGDEQVLAACYEGAEEVTLQVWTERIAEEWGVSLKELREDMSRQNTPDTE
ncbi:hypothetical protein C8034_v002212 [Colletotrichum sidae]|uniref:Uncharacterized protein n=1 Tax=Colletotrichum sidae TaxID=1347389 RepID=A0A4R8TCX8_9PEZI|nr:hypothetical protein C8034_v002212 [Colletotrichum sidae]